VAVNLKSLIFCPSGEYGAELIRKLFEEYPFSWFEIATHRQF
jgi:hypothetical protein